MAISIHSPAHKNDGGVLAGMGIPMRPKGKFECGKIEERKTQHDFDSVLDMKKENQESQVRAAVPVTQLAKPDRIGHGHRRPLLVSSVVHPRYGVALLEPLHQHFDLDGGTRLSGFGIVSNGGWGVARAAPAEGRRLPDIHGPSGSLPSARPAEHGDLPCRGRAVPSAFGSGQLQLLPIHRIGAILRGNLPYGDEAGINRPRAGPHARVACAECHIGPGASWFVRSKLSGSYQIYATASTNIRVPFPRRLKICVPPVKPASNAIGQGNSSGTWIKPFITL